MLEIGKRIFYDIATGDVIVSTSERSGDVVETTVEYDISVYKALSERNRDTFGYIELTYGQYSQDFDECSSYKIDVETETLIFSYPNPNVPEVEQSYRPSLSDSVEQQMDYLLDLDFRTSMIELGLHEEELV